MTSKIHNIAIAAIDVAGRGEAGGAGLPIEIPVMVELTKNLLFPQFQFLSAFFAFNIHVYYNN